MYEIHNNGGRPYKIKIKGKNIDIYSNDLPVNIHISLKNVDKIFIGKSILNEMTRFSGGYGKKFDGNTIIIKPTKTNSYLYLGGNDIVSFTTKYEIVKYFSPIGNNDVPYPYAIDTKNNYYLLAENIMFPGNLINEENPYDPYDTYYNMTKKEKKHTKKISGFK
jgi:hypothetical protein